MDPSYPYAAELKYLRDTLSVVGGKWRLPILLSLSRGNMRFNQLKKSMPGITARTLSRELRELEMNRIIVRKPDPEGYVGMEYEVTEYCRSFDLVIDSMIQWGKEHRKVI
ncbi:MAG: helix-turn-helix transcriptional regulator [Dyadobacter sp.]|uniref:winged helix-turn-helix transcriptional regulator n=1 Tax=Dyadobacter sp. TaxID=1914288 RepID=UPI001B291108|nr:helix-turn-helix domain-containing protein [Dyadobacter sp.]MBO9616460.1 helix-turn-helix transcriptional regulator [Dyadobacter sp.]